jgi:hypothetical protein
MKLLFTVLFHAALLQPVESFKKFLRQRQQSDEAQPTFEAQDPGSDVDVSPQNTFQKFKEIVSRMEQMKRVEQQLGINTKELHKESLREARNVTNDQFTGDPALAAVAGVGPGDFFTKGWTGENAADAKRGKGGCTAWRRTLQCNPSGTRDPLKDKSCEEVIPSGESGFCECGEYAQFAAVDCKHRPFTCESMCVKYAVMTNKQAFYRGRALSPQESMDMFNHLMWGNQTDLQAMRIMTNEMINFVNKAMQYTTEQGREADQALRKFQSMMKQAKKVDAARADAEFAKYKDALKDTPWLSIYKEGGKMISAGQKIQAKVKEVLPFDPLNSPKRARVAPRK